MTPNGNQPHPCTLCRPREREQSETPTTMHSPSTSLITNNYLNTSAPPHANAQKIQPPTNQKRRFLYVEQASDEEEATDHNLCPARNHIPTDVLWKYKKEFAKNLSNKSGASRVVRSPKKVRVQGDWQIVTSQEQYLVHWMPSAIKKWPFHTI